MKVYTSAPDQVASSKEEKAMRFCALWPEPWPTQAYPEIAGSLPIAVAIHAWQLALVIQGEAAAAKGIVILGVHVIVLPTIQRSTSDLSS